MDSDNFAQPISSSYFERRDDLTLGDDEIVVVSCMRNEGQRLPYFLDYYRRLGVTRFLLVDNDSDDGTREFLAEQPDVEYFWTNGSYRGSSAGRLWLQELADTYATDRWVITADVDELLVFPGAEVMSLRDLCAYFDEHGHEGLFTVMLDMYSDRPLSQTRYHQGDDFLATCPYFETDTYTVAPGANPPFLSIFGGPRDRLFRADVSTGRKPMMKKIPLVKWRRGFSYIYSTHSHRFVQLSDITGTLMHFKFFSTFSELAAIEAQRGDRRQQMHYSSYRDSAADDVCFYSSESLRYRGPADFVRLGVMRSSPAYAAFVRSRRIPGSATDGSEFLPEVVAAEGKMTLRSVAAVWPLVNNGAIAEYFGVKVTPPRDHRLALVQEMSRHVRVTDVKGDHILVRLAEPAMHRWQRSKVGMSIYVGRRLVTSVLIDGSDEAFSVDVGSLEPNMCRLNVDIARAALIEGGARPSVMVTAYLFDGTDPARLAATSAAAVGEDDLLIYSRPWFAEGGNVAFVESYRGVVDRLQGGRLHGWAYDTERDSFDVPLCIYMNGRLAHHVWPSERREGLDQLSRNGSARGRGFLVDLPLGYFRAAGESSVRVEVVIAGTNLQIRRSPITLPSHASEATWDNQARKWDTAQAAIESGAVAAEGEPASRPVGS